VSASGAMSLDRFFASYYRLRPVNATFTGVHDHDDRLPDWSPRGIEAAADEMRALRDDLTHADDSADVDVELAGAFLEIQLAELAGRHFQRGNPALFTGEAIFAVVALMTREFAPVEQRIDAAIARMEAIPRFLAAARDAMSSAPREWTRRAVRECGGAAALFGPSMAEWLRACRAGPSRTRQALAAAEVAARAFAAYREWCQGELAEAPDASYACGPEFYDLLLRRGHCCERNRADLLDEARERLRDAVERLATMAGREARGGWVEVQERLAGLHPSVGGYLARYEELWRECRRLAEERDLVTWPDSPIRYAPIPAFMRDAAPSLYYLFYRSPAPLDGQAVHDYVVTPIEPTMPRDEQERLLRATNDSVIKLNHVVHHGAVGHHVQNYYAYRAPSRIGRIAAVDCASRIGMFCGGSLAEGWACYATDLMEEAGFLTDLERIAEQHTRVRLLARAVVDVELHQTTMAFEDAVAFYVTQVGMAPVAARTEAVRNSMFPGTAIMYWLGTQGLHDLRAERSAADGPRFSLRAFHDELLRYGSLPVPLIARHMRQANDQQAKCKSGRG
jgi:uncharacterized protein (DUF885 family)